MEKSLSFLEKRASSLISINFTTVAFIILFFTETSYYLLILQTGIVDCFHSDISKIWMIPVGGVLGLITMTRVKHHEIFVSIALFFQTLLMFFYPTFNALMLFSLGVLSGLVAPYLIYQLKSLTQIVIILGLAYLLSTFAIHILPENRGVLAIFLSMIALFSSYFVVPIRRKRVKKIRLKSYFWIFIWLILDAVLFEVLSRSSFGIWGHEEFTLLIAIFHMLGLYIGYKLITFKYNNLVILTLFSLSYLFFAFNLSYLLAIVYPIVISYYNVVLLKHFMALSFGELTLVSLSLWISSGMGLTIALISHNLI